MRLAPPSASAMQRLGVGSELPAVLQELGADPAALFSEIGMDLSAVSPDTRLAFPKLLHLLHRSVQITRCEHLGLLCGLRFEMHHHGAIGALMQVAPTLRQALEDFVTLQAGHSSGATVYLHRSGPDHFFGYGLYTQTHPGAAVLYDLAVGVGVRMVRLLSHSAAAPVEVQMNHRAPVNRSVHARLLRAPVRFNQLRTCLVLDEPTMSITLSGANPAKRRETLELFARAERSTSEALSPRVRIEIRRALLHGPPRMPDIAGRLGINERTLRRKLMAEGTSFATLNDEVRFAVAKELLLLTKLPISDIGSAIGIASPSVFAETFRRWSGGTATSIRSAAQA